MQSHPIGTRVMAELFFSVKGNYGGRGHLVEARARRAMEPPSEAYRKPKKR